MANDKRSELARLIAEVMPGDLDHTFFTNGGAEANENAIKLARWVTGRQKVIARYRSYHGATGGAISLTGDPGAGRRTGCPASSACSTRTRTAAPPAIPTRARSARAGLTSKSSSSTRVPHTVAAVILETIVGTNGEPRPA